MLIELSQMSSGWFWFSNLMAVAALLLVILTAQWSLVISVSTRHHLLFGSVFILTGFWLMEFSVIQGLFIHPIIMTSATLMLGFRFGSIAGCVSAVIYLWFAQHPIENWGFYTLTNVFIPAAFVTGLTRWLRRMNPNNLFFYTLGVGFLGGALTVPLVAATGFLLVYFFDFTWHSGVALQPEWILLAMFPEAFINGVIVSSITVFFPEWMKTFDEEYFLSR